MDTFVTEEREMETIRELIDRMALARGEDVFLISPETGRVLTFRALQKQSKAISARLRRVGLEPGDKVAFLLDNGLFTVQLFLGTMYGGFVSVPLNVRAGVSQLAYTLDHCDAKVLFVEDQYRRPGRGSPGWCQPDGAGDSCRRRRLCHGSRHITRRRPLETLAEKM